MLAEAKSQSFDCDTGKFWHCIMSTSMSLNLIPIKFIAFLLLIKEGAAIRVPTKKCLLERRVFSRAAAAAMAPGSFIAPLPSLAAERVAWDCSGGNCLGVSDGLLASCDSTSCVSSQDDATGGGSCFAEPWTYDLTLDEAFQLLRRTVERRVGANSGEEVSITSVVEEKSFRYLRVTYGERDDVEFFLPANDVTVQFRAARRSRQPDFRANARRLEAIRVSLRFEKIPVVRNRREAFFGIFGESAFDSFGPAVGIAADVDPAATETREELERAMRHVEKARNIRMPPGRSEARSPLC